ncbi:nucleotidyltransferase domain-containing protein [Actinomadura kijaniata]|uniref:nucleotidyltransferase domain-containing protein n=1 Tax=Actinomadura kijaniata TaxID=46161 RepID=UPI00082C4557|nr:nucleotidyltransferase domain-containing protein [Actinomadura kijaniata]
MNLPEDLLTEVRDWHPYPRAFVTVSGAHLYGFPSRDSDIDLRGLHLLPLERVVGLEGGGETVSRMWDHRGVEADVVTHDLAKFCNLLLKRSGEVLEQLVSPLVVETSPLHEELLSHVPALVCRQHAHHYLGFSRGQWRQYEKDGRLKPLLYTFRTLLTGIHLMRSGEVETDLPRLAAEYGPGYLPDLIEAKIHAEHGEPPATLDRARAERDHASLTARLEEERDRSHLPDRTTAHPALNTLVIRTRLAGTAT